MKDYEKFNKVMEEIELRLRQLEDCQSKLVDLGFEAEFGIDRGLYLWVKKVVKAEKSQRRE